MNEVSWLIERNDLGEYTFWYAETKPGWHWWTPDASEALRFATKAEVEDFEPYRMISSDPHISITEHVFL